MKTTHQGTRCLLMILYGSLLLHIEALEPELEGKELSFDFKIYFSNRTPDYTTTITTTTTTTTTAATTTTTTATTTLVPTAGGVETTTESERVESTVHGITASSEGPASSAPDVTTAESGTTPASDVTSTVQDTAASTTNLTAFQLEDLESYQEDNGTTLSPDTTVTTAQSMPPPDSGRVAQWLISLYNGTTGYKGLELTEIIIISFMSDGKPVVTEEIVYEISFSLVYDVRKLSDEGLIKIPGILTQIYQSHAALLVHNSTISDDWYVQPHRTNTSLEEGREDAVEKLDNPCSHIGAVCGDNEFNCKVVTSGSITCIQRCAFLIRDMSWRCDENPGGHAIYVKGSCDHDQYGNAYCNCGRSPGSVLPNLYDGTRCVSAAFVVGMSAGLGGGLILLLLLAVITLGVINSKQKKQIVEYKLSADYIEPPTPYRYPSDYENLLKMSDPSCSNGGLSDGRSNPTYEFEECRM